LRELNVAIKDMVTCASQFVQGVLPYACPLVPMLIARAPPGSAREAEMNQVALLHAVLSELSHLVFSKFRAAELMVDSTFLSSATGTAKEEDWRLLLLIEQRKAAFWLKSIGEAAAGAAKLTDNTARSMAMQMIQCLFSSKWDAMGTSAQQLGEHVLPAAVAAVTAAMKAQVIASSMHSRLLQLCVPGWLQCNSIALGPQLQQAWLHNGQASLQCPQSTCSPVRSYWLISKR